MSRKHFALQQRPAAGSGSGPVTLRVVKASPDQAVLEMGIDYSKAEIPERAYYADYCDVLRGRVGFSLVFGKLDPGTCRLRTKIEVAFPEQMFLQQLWGTSRDFQRAVQADAMRAPIVPVAEVEDTDKVQTFRSNNVMMGAWGEESVMDFYYISPRDMHFVRQEAKTNVELEPVVRVVMGTPLIFEFLQKCQPYVDQLSKTAPPAEGIPTIERET
jgi:hypothetical protein